MADTSAQRCTKGQACRTIEHPSSKGTSRHTDTARANTHTHTLVRTLAHTGRQRARPVQTDGQTDRERETEERKDSQIVR